MTGACFYLDLAQVQYNYDDISSEPHESEVTVKAAGSHHAYHPYHTSKATDKSPQPTRKVSDGQYTSQEDILMSSNIDATMTEFSDSLYIDYFEKFKSVNKKKSNLAKRYFSSPHTLDDNLRAERLSSPLENLVDEKHYEEFQSGSITPDSIQPPAPPPPTATSPSGQKFEFLNNQYNGLNATAKKIPKSHDISNNNTNKSRSTYSRLNQVVNENYRTIEHTDMQEESSCSTAAASSVSSLHDTTSLSSPVKINTTKLGTFRHDTMVRFIIQTILFFENIPKFKILLFILFD